MTTFALLAMLFAFPALALAQFGQAGPAQPSAGSPPQSGDEQALREMDRRLLEAVIKGDSSFFESLLTDDAIITDRNGRVTTKAEALKTFQPLPDLKFALTREDVRVHIHGDAAVLSARRGDGPGGEPDHQSRRAHHRHVRAPGWQVSDLMLIRNVRRESAR